jgi:4-hydroxy-3-methylbut-2-en-1-yl diphosphate reductase
MIVEKAKNTGFCYGVKRAMDILEKEAATRGHIESLGEVVHNRHVMRRLAGKGVETVPGIAKIKGRVIVLGTHGVAPEIEAELKARGIETIDTTCPFVRRAQAAAKKLAEEDYFIIVYGDPDHAEVKGILGCTGGKGLATRDPGVIINMAKIPRRIGLLSQTTQVPERFREFINDIMPAVYQKDGEIRIMDTICHDVRDRQSAALATAKNVDVMIVVGGVNSANTSHLADLCGKAVPTYKIETADELKREWFAGKKKAGITAGASTADEEIDEVERRLLKIE